MTWWDHETNSIWSQPTGEVLVGSLLGTKLKALPFQLTTWSNWFNTHPETMVMENGLERLGVSRERFSTDFLIGVELADLAKAYAFEDALTAGIIEDQLGEFPLLIWADGEDYRVFLRQIGDVQLQFAWEDGFLVDVQTGSRWDPRLGLARDGNFAGEVLQQIPSFSIWERSWWDFFPDGEIYRE